MKKYANYENLIESAKNYDRPEDFITETGWEDWMANLLKDQGRPTEDGEELTERQNSLIDEYLKNVWAAAHK